jgi:hypothetical protein
MELIMREADFWEQLHGIVNSTVYGLEKDQKIDLIRGACEFYQALPAGKNIPGITFLPFVTGRRSTDEAAHPGLGSSDHSGMILGEAGTDVQNKIYLLYDLVGLDGLTKEELEKITLDCTLSFTGTNGFVVAQPVSGWDKRTVEPAKFSLDEAGIPTLQKTSLSDLPTQRLVLSISPEFDLLPWPGPKMDQLDPQIQRRATEAGDAFTFGELFSQMVHVQLRLVRQGLPIAAAQTWVDVCDTRRFTSLYMRVIDRLITSDTQNQAIKAGSLVFDPAYHPWYPVLLIGSEKARQYLRALIEDIVHKQHHLTDPRWLMRVGIYLEFLTCIGIFEAVKADMGDLLTPVERSIYENSPVFAEIRKRVNLDGWRKVWELREIVLPKFGALQTGPVSASNLLQKKKATLAFLQMHHNDLKHAIELAGVNSYNAQETWHRVFRDAERAVLRKTRDAFPELTFLNPNLNEFILWHRKGRFDIAGIHLSPNQFSALMGDQDGLFAYACNQYRASMNQVAEWAKRKGLMDYTGKECIPCQVSLLQAYMDGQLDQVNRLQRRDGYEGSLDTFVELPKGYISSEEEIYLLLKQVSIFGLLSEDEIRHIARTSRAIQLGPMERIIIQGRQGNSLFLVGDGELEVLVRQNDGVDHRVGVLKRGDIVGEMSLLTGEPRSATVRSVNGGMVYEIGKNQYEPIIKSRPELVEQLADLMEQHTRKTSLEVEAYRQAQGASDFSRRIRLFFLGAG